MECQFLVIWFSTFISYRFQYYTVTTLSKLIFVYDLQDYSCVGHCLISTCSVSALYNLGRIKNWFEGNLELTWLARELVNVRS